MLALLALIPTKDKLYAVAILAILVGAVAFVRHERSVGADGVRTAVVKAEAAQAALAAEKTQHASDNALQAEKLFVGVTSAPPSPDAPHLFVHVNSSLATVCPSVDPSVSVNAAVSASADSEVDIGPPLDTVGRNSDAQVVFLQSLIKSCIDIGACEAAK